MSPPGAILKFEGISTATNKGHLDGDARTCVCACACKYILGNELLMYRMHHAYIRYMPHKNHFLRIFKLTRSELASNVTAK